MTYGKKEYEAEINAFEKKHGKDTIFIEKNGTKVTKKDFYNKLIDTHKEEEFKIPLKCMVCEKLVDDCVCDGIEYAEFLMNVE